MLNSEVTKWASKNNLDKGDEIGAFNEPLQAEISA